MGTPCAADAAIATVAGPMPEDGVAVSQDFDELMLQDAVAEPPVVMTSDCVEGVGCTAVAANSIVVGAMISGGFAVTSKLIVTWRGESFAAGSVTVRCPT